MNDNPLIKAYRKPAMYITLPSGGEYYDPKPNLSVDGELAVYSMTARDEIITKSPDALFNGEATVSLIKSCCPDIADPNQIPVNDLLMIMIGIRQASYGKEIDIDIACEKCSEMNAMSVDANRLMSRHTPTEVQNKLKLENDFVVRLKPYTLSERTLMQIQQVKQQKMIQGVMKSQDTSEEQQAKIFGKTFVELADLTVNLITNCVMSVRMPDDQVIDDKDMIREWLKSITKDDYESIRKVIEGLSDSGIDTKFKTTCQSCQHTWEADVDLDISNFFVG